MTDTMTIRQMCEDFDVTPRALRFYETKELLSPIREGQKRLYTKRERARLSLILRGKRYGFSLEEIRQLLDLYNSEGGLEAQMRSAREIGARHLERMKVQAHQLNLAITDLTNELNCNQANVANCAAEKAA